MNPGSMKNILCMILGGGRGTRLYPLTAHRSKPAVPLAGKYRLIDIPISNCLNSGINKIYVLTQFLSVSLHRHISHSYRLDHFGGGFVEILAAQQTIESSEWYQGTADAVRQNVRYLQEPWIHQVLILSGDQLYRMDFHALVETHHNNRADITIAVIPVARGDAPSLGIVRLDDSGRVIHFVEKPQTEEALDSVRTPVEWIERRGITARNRQYLASMGIYLFNKDVLLTLLDHKPPYADFGKEVFPNSYRRYRVQAHLFDGYWEDLGTVKAYHQASLALTQDNPPFFFHAPEGVIYTRMRFLPASRISGATIQNCLVSDGCIVMQGADLKRSIIGVRSRICPNVTMRDTIMIGADRYETDEERRRNRLEGRPDIGIGEGSVIERAILDKDCRIGRNVRITNQRNLENADGPNYAIRDGIVVIPKEVIVPDGTVI
ncbi:MAG: glucose-1-phosphate adenylyltransferase [Gemmatales bacterium]|nr:glucose-1-phosphate adenylyltransferase [Gemmatales bacterium]MDW8387371.1 glucose-1-phosphate adenylyltransferase [Gemmatales bacterium]